MRRTKLERSLMISGAGAGIGTLQSILFKEYFDPNFGTVPFIDTVIPFPWNRWSTFGSLSIGIVSAVSSQFLKNKDLSNYLLVYGITCSIAGITYGIFPGVTPPGARFRRPMGAGIRRVPRVTPRVVRGRLPPGAQETQTRADGLTPTFIRPSERVPPSKILA